MTAMSGWSGLARRNARRVFRDRRDAGEVLADELASYRGTVDLLVLGLARGGVPVGWQVAHALRAPLDVFVVRKLGLPGHEELAVLGETKDKRDRNKHPGDGAKDTIEALRKNERPREFASSFEFCEMRRQFFEAADGDRIAAAERLKKAR